METCQNMKIRKKNNAFGKPCLCLRDTRHFRRFTGFEQQSPCFIAYNANSAFSPFSSKTPSFWRDKNTVYQKHRFLDPEKRAMKNRVGRFKSLGFKLDCLLAGSPEHGCSSYCSLLREQEALWRSCLGFPPHFKGPQTMKSHCELKNWNFGG